MASILMVVVAVTVTSVVAKSPNLRGLQASSTSTCATFSGWPSVDNGITCGNCRALVLTEPYHGRCDTYCKSFGHVCIAAAEEANENCEVKYAAACNEEIQGTSDMLCTCQASTQTTTCDAHCEIDGESHSCRARVDYLQTQGGTFSFALQQVNVECDTQCFCSAEDFGDQTDPSTMTTATTPHTITTITTASSQTTTCDAQCQIHGDSHSCRARVEFLRTNGYTSSAALQRVNLECDTQCSCSDGDIAGQTSPTTTTNPSTSTTLTVMSYNTQYSGYPGRVNQYGNLIRNVDAGVVGTQECQDKHALAEASGYQLVPGTDFQNPIFYNPDKVSFVHGTGGWMRIPRDNHAERTITWAKFIHDSTEFWFFNTHLPHRHGEASSANTHAEVAQRLLQKRIELGAGNTPTVITGDCNPFASSGSSRGSFESNLVAASFEKSYEAQGNPGYRGLDKIFASSHWTSSNGADQGTGSSDHPAITVDLTLNK